jgi:hypothetical protein
MVMTKTEPDLRVLWWSAPPAGVGWHPIVVGDAEDECKQRERLRKMFRGSGGVETYVKEYVEKRERKARRAD